MPVPLNRREFVVAGSTLAAASLMTTHASEKAARPNIVVIVVDDMRFDEFGAGGHPYLKTPFIDGLARRGASFNNAYHTTPLCSPNRASILTGQYASKHGILDNTSRAYSSHELNTFARELKQIGYDTAHVGKWHMGNDPTPRPGYDYWVSFEGQGKTDDPDLYEDGRIGRVNGYVTDILTDRAIKFATQKRDKPFMVYLGHKAIHPQLKQNDDGSVDIGAGKAFVPAARHKGIYAGKTFPRTPNYGMPDSLKRNQPVTAQAVERRGAPDMSELQYQDEIDAPLISDEIIQQRAEMMLAVDEGVGRFIAELEENQLLENTVFVLMSDNGYFFGEHGLGIERRFPYEESIRCPLIISHPAAIQANTQIDPFALSIDIAPTLIAVAGNTPPERMQGRSLLPLLQNQSAEELAWRKAFLVEYYSHDNPFPWAANLDYRAIRTGQFKYVRWLRKEGVDELYDLKTDPYEQLNLNDLPEFAEVRQTAIAQMSDLVLASMGFPSATAL